MAGECIHRLSGPAWAWLRPVSGNPAAYFFYSFHEELMVPIVLVPVDNLGWGGLGVSHKDLHFIPQGDVLGDVN